MTSPTKLNFYADFQGLAALKKDAKADAPEALKEAAKQFESLFTRMLLKNMRATSMGNELFDSEQTKFYQDMFDDQMAVHLSQGKGLGLADMLVRQLQQAHPAGRGAGGVGPGPEKGNGDSASSDLQPTTGRKSRGTAYSPQPRPSSDPPGPGPTPQAQRKASFIQAVLPHAERAAKALGVDPHALVAQAALETGWGKSLPKNADGSPSYNLFGIKATPMWNGPAVDSETLEFESGALVSKQERFRAYANASDSFDDYTNLIARSPRYAAVRNTGANVQAFAEGLQNGGYATDPHYARKLTAVAAQVRSIAAAMQPEALKLADATPITNNEGVRG